MFMAPATAKNQFQAPKERFASEKSAKLMLFCIFLFAGGDLFGAACCCEMFGSMKIHETYSWCQITKASLRTTKCWFIYFIFWGIIPNFAYLRLVKHCATVKLDCIAILENGHQLPNKDHPGISSYIH